MRNKEFFWKKRGFIRYLGAIKMGLTHFSPTHIGPLSNKGLSRYSPYFAIPIKSRPKFLPFAISRTMNNCNCSLRQSVCSSKLYIRVYVASRGVKMSDLGGLKWVIGTSESAHLYSFNYMSMNMLVKKWVGQPNYLFITRLF
mgnify:CR=1 FL=1